MHARNFPASPSATGSAPSPRPASAPQRTEFAPHPDARAIAVPELSAATSFALGHGLDVPRFTALHAQNSRGGHSARVTPTTMTPYHHAVAARFGKSAETFCAEHNRLHRLA